MSATARDERFSSSINAALRATPSPRLSAWPAACFEGGSIERMIVEGERDQDAAREALQRAVYDHLLSLCACPHSTENSRNSAVLSISKGSFVFW